MDAVTEMQDMQTAPDMDNVDKNMSHQKNHLS